MFARIAMLLSGACMHPHVPCMTGSSLCFSQAEAVAGWCVHLHLACASVFYRNQHEVELVPCTGPVRSPLRGCGTMVPSEAELPRGV